jgi:hypothetical protein
MGAACTVYGSRTSLILYDTQNKKVEEYTLMITQPKNEEKWVMT